MSTDTQRPTAPRLSPQEGVAASTLGAALARQRKGDLAAVSVQVPASCMTPSLEPFGPFVLLQRLAVGGQAEVFLAKPSRGVTPAHQLVIKRLLAPRRGQEAYQDLSREADLQQKAAHPNVVRSFGAGMIEDTPYLALEHIDGVNLYRLLQRARAEGRKLEPEVSLSIIHLVGRALAQVHALKQTHAGIDYPAVHADVTASNVLLSIAGDVKLGDFGIAHYALPEVIGNEPSQIRGKCGYLPPEILNAEPHDCRADQFSLAVMLGEMLINRGIFSGEGPLAILMSIREGDMAPLHQNRNLIPPGVYEILLRALATEKEARFPTTSSLVEALEPFVVEHALTIRERIATWVAWGRDEERFTNLLERRIRKSVQRIQLPAGSLSEQSASTQQRDSEPSSSNQSPKIIGEPAAASVRRAGQVYAREVPLGRLVEMIVAGELTDTDEVAIMGSPYRPLGSIDELARHILPTTNAVTGRMFEPGVPDFTADFAHVPALRILARMRMGRETGALFAHRKRQGTPERRDIYLHEGRLVHVTSSASEELLGEYLVRHDMLKRHELEVALSMMNDHGGRLGDALIALKLVSAVDVYRAIRNQGRDRVAALGRWNAGEVHFYRTVKPSREHLRVDLDLTIPMMAGVILASKGRPELPARTRWVHPGPSLPQSEDAAELKNTPTSLRLVPQICQQSIAADTAVRELTRYVPQRAARPGSSREAVTALLVAEALEWISFAET